MQKVRSELRDDLSEEKELFATISSSNCH